MGVGLYRDGVMTGAQMHVPKADFDALAREVDELLSFAPQPLEQPSKPAAAKSLSDALVVRTVCGDIRVTSPEDCESVSTIYKTPRAT